MASTTRPEAPAAAGTARSPARRLPPDRPTARISGLPTWLSAVALAALLAAVWGATLVAGGSRTPVPHLFYVPIVLSTLAFSFRGVLVTALLATVLAGPLLPLDTVSGEAQQPSFWLIRGAMFVAVGAVATLATTLHERSYAERLTGEIRTAISRPFAGAPPVERDLIPLVRDVLEQRSFEPVFQPIYSLVDGRLTGVEALTRFRVEPYRSPDVWFAAAEVAGLGRELELATLEAAVARLADLPPEVGISLNASPATLGDPAFRALVQSLAGRRVTVEVTEHAVIEDYPVLTRQIHALRQTGVLLAVDDAGAGVASLQHIVQLAPDIIKLDISLTQQVDASPLRRALAGSLIEFAERSGAQLLVEGIEQPEDLRTWTALGAHAAQGYLIGRPGPLPHPLHSTEIAALRRITVRDR